MKVFEVWGELSLKDTLTQDLAAIQAKVNQAATGIQQSLSRAGSTGGVGNALNEAIRQLNLTPYQKAFERIDKEVQNFKNKATAAFDAQVKAADAAGASVQQLTSIYNRYLSTLKEAERYGDLKKSTVSATGKADLLTGQEKEFNKAFDLMNKDLDNTAKYNAKKEEQNRKSFESYEKYNDAISKQMNDMWSQREQEIQRQKDQDMRRFETATKAATPKETSSDSALTAAMKENDAFLKSRDKIIGEIKSAQNRESQALKEYTLSIQSQFDKMIQARETAAVREQQAAQKYALAVQSQMTKAYGGQSLYNAAETERMKKYTLDIQSQFDKVRAASEKAAQVSEGSWPKTTKAMDNLHRTLQRLQRTAGVYIGMWLAFQAKDLIVFPVTEAIRFNSELEKVKLGIASLFNAQGKFVDSSGGAATGFDALTEGLKLADKVLEQLKIDSLSTMATFEQLAKAYQAATAPALSVGISDPDKIRQYAVAMVQAASAMNVPLDMMAEELRSMLKGTITPKNTIIATYLGITPEQIRQYQGDSEQLFNFVMGKLESFNTAGKATQETWAGLTSNVKEGLSMIFAESGRGFFAYFKNELKDIQKYLIVIDEKTRTMKLNPEVVSAMEKFYNFVKALYEIVKFPIVLTVKFSVGVSNELDEIDKQLKSLKTLTRDLGRTDQAFGKYMFQSGGSSKPFGWVGDVVNLLKQDDWAKKAEEMANNADKVISNQNRKFVPNPPATDQKVTLEAIEILQSRINNLLDTQNKLLDRAANHQERIKNSLDNRLGLEDEIANIEDRQQAANQLQTEIMLAQNRMRAAFTPEGKQEWAAYIEELTQAFNEVNPGAGVENYLAELRNKVRAENDFMLQEQQAAMEKSRAAMDAYNSKLYKMIEEQNSKMEVQQGDKLDVKTIQEGINTFLKEQSNIENNIYNTEQKRNDLLRFMKNNNLSGDEWQAATQQLAAYDAELMEAGWQIKVINDYLIELERKREIILDANPDNAIGQIKMIETELYSLDDIIRTPREVIISTDSAKAKILELQRMMQSVTSGLSGGSAGPLGGFSLGETFGNMESDYVINFMGSASPVKPIGQTISDVIGKLNNLPGGMDYQINFLMNKAGLDAQTSARIVAANMNLNNLYAQLDKAKAQQYEYEKGRYGGYVNPSTGAMADYYANTVIPKLENMIQQAQLSLYSSFGSYTTGNNSKNASVSGGSSSGGGVSVQIGSIIINAGSGDAKAQAITLADRIDEELARKFKSSDSKLLNSIRKGSLK